MTADTLPVIVKQHEVVLSGRWFAPAEHGVRSFDFLVACRGHDGRCGCGCRCVFMVDPGSFRRDPRRAAYCLLAGRRGGVVPVFPPYGRWFHFVVFAGSSFSIWFRLWQMPLATFLTVMTPTSKLCILFFHSSSPFLLH